MLHAAQEEPEVGQTLLGLGHMGLVRLRPLLVEAEKTFEEDLAAGLWGVVEGLVSTEEVHRRQGRCPVVARKTAVGSGKAKLRH